MRRNFPFSRKLKLSNYFGHLLEQEDLFGGGEEGGDEGAEEGGDEGGEEETAEAGGDEGDKEGGEEKEDKEEDKPKISAEDKARFSDSIDDELEGLMVDYETDARKAAAIQSEKMKTESLRRVYRGILYEVAADDIDLKHFANNVARLVKNYDTLMDMKSIILNKAYSYIKNNYGDDTVKALKDTLEQDFDIEVERPEIEKDEPEVPIAVGAGGGAGGAGGA
jgi:hypothetical protein